MKNASVFLLALVCSGALASEKTENSRFGIDRGDVSKISLNLDFAGSSEITMTLAGPKQEVFREFTKDNLGKKVEIVVDGKIVASPVINSIILSSDLTISTAHASDALDIAQHLAPEKQTSSKPASDTKFPYAITSGKPGFVSSPYAAGAATGVIDVRGFPKDTEVKDPYTGKIFLVPETTEAPEP